MRWQCPQSDVAGILVDGAVTISCLLEFLRTISSHGPRRHSGKFSRLPTAGARGRRQSGIVADYQVRPGGLAQSCRWYQLSGAWSASISINAKLIAPGFGEGTSTPCRAASLAFSGTSFLRSA